MRASGLVNFSELDTNLSTYQSTDEPLWTLYENNEITSKIRISGAEILWKVPTGTLGPAFTETISYLLVLALVKSLDC